MLHTSLSLRSGARSPAAGGSRVAAGTSPDLGVVLARIRGDRVPGGGRSSGRGPLHRARVATPWRWQPFDGSGGPDGRTADGRGQRAKRRRPRILSGAGIRDRAPLADRPLRTALSTIAPRGIT